MKTYVKPSLDIINLRPEEGLACHGSYDSPSCGGGNHYGNWGWFWDWWKRNRN